MKFIRHLLAVAVIGATAVAAAQPGPGPGRMGGPGARWGSDSRAATPVRG